ncbi:MAG: riboflavin kinase [Candidatus Bipolaricaulota bacterium]
MRVVAVGRFDGVHLGHRALLESARKLAERRELRLTAYTFPATPPALLTTEAKESLLARLADEVLVVGWNAVHNMDAEAFLRRELAGRLAARALVMGTNHRFGTGRQGDPELARRLAPELGMEVQVVPALELAGGPVSARRIRELLRSGQVAQARGLLGRPPILWGTPVSGAGVGRELGWPTINLQLSPEILLPAYGVYVAWAQHTAGRAPALFYLGSRPTFPGLSSSAELHLLQQPAHPPGDLVEVHLLSYLRGDHRFPDVESLKEQIRRDADLANDELSRSAAPASVLI